MLKREKNSEYGRIVKHWDPATVIAEIAQRIMK
jgi:hypothetical protein